MRDGTNALEDALFAELKALQSVDVSDREAVQAAVSHSKAVEGLAHAITDNHRVALDASRIMTEYQGAAKIKMPKLLEDSDGGDGQ